MQSISGSSSSVFLSTLPPGKVDRAIALGVLLVSLLFFVAAAPFAKQPLPPMPAFLPVYQSALVLCDLITAVLLFGQYAILRSRALLVLACGYLFSAAMAVAHALSFPGLFAAGGLLGGGVQTTAWLYFFWHAGFPAFVLAYALLKGRARDGGPVARDLAAGIAGTLALAMLTTLVGTAGHDSLPAIMQGSQDAAGKLAVAQATWAFGLAALVVLWRCRPHSVLDLWLMVVLFAWACDSGLAAVMNHGRFDLGWYAGRVYGLMASGFVLAVLLLENGMLYAWLAEANDAQRRRAQALQELSSQLQVANRDLDAFAGGVAHDLRQPLTTIASFAQVVVRQGQGRLARSDVEHLNRIMVAAASAQRMIQGLLEFARLGQQALQTEQVDLNRVVEEARGALAGEREAQAVTWKVAPLPVVRGDRSLLVLAFVNLLSNGLKYSRTQPAPAIEIAGRWDPALGHVVEVRDNGVGFDMAQAGRLFRPFERLHSEREFEGTGLGLANVRRIMERHGGSVQVESAPGRGAAFTLLFRR